MSSAPSRNSTAPSNASKMRRGEYFMGRFSFLMILNTSRFSAPISAGMPARNRHTEPPAGARRHSAPPARRCRPSSGTEEMDSRQDWDSRRTVRDKAARSIRIGTRRPDIARAGLVSQRTLPSGTAGIAIWTHSYLRHDQTRDSDIQFIGRGFSGRPRHASLAANHAAWRGAQGPECQRQPQRRANQQRPRQNQHGLLQTVPGVGKPPDDFRRPVVAEQMNHENRTRHSAGTQVYRDRFDDERIHRAGRKEQ